MYENAERQYYEKLAKVHIWKISLYFICTWNIFNLLQIRKFTILSHNEQVIA